MIAFDEPERMSAIVCSEFRKGNTSRASFSVSRAISREENWCYNVLFQIFNGHFFDNYILKQLLIQ